MKNIFAEFIKFIRDEQQFASIDDLKAQLNKDKQKAKIQDIL